MKDDERQAAARGALAAEILHDFMTRCDNSSVYKIVFELVNFGTELPTGWQYVGDAADARFRQLLSQRGYIQISATPGRRLRGDRITRLIANS